MSQSGPIYEGEPMRHERNTRTISAAKAGVSFGSALAITISWSQHHSILWAIIHGILSWLYVAWYAITR
ncbi:MAG TPA: hypothetical protein VGD77_01825 [Gemmatimonadaceae bacterium]